MTPAVAIVGDGPAGSALAQACVRAGVDVALVGGDDPWTATYGGWQDELDLVPPGLLAADVVASRHPDIVAWSDRRHDLGRTYAVLANDRLRDVLRDGVEHVVDRAATVDPGHAIHHVRLDSGATITTRLVVDATGWPARFAEAVARGRPPAWQSAFGVVLSDRPDGDLGEPTLMDFRKIGSDTLGAPTFAYALPVADGWLVEETVLAARPALDPDRLAGRLAARLDTTVEELLDRAVRVERVRIPMGGPPPRRDQPVVAFGAAAGYVNPTSGYSVVHSLRTAPAVAAAIVAALANAPAARVAPVEPVWDAVWPLAARRTRVLHEYGLERLLGFDDDALRGFFRAFFELPTERWSAYMATASPPGDVAKAMTAVFSAAPWSTRLRLAAGNPLAFARLLRPG